MWADLHQRLAEHYETARDGLGLDAEQGHKDSAWQELALEALYHRLCQAPKANLPAAVNGFPIAAKGQRTFRRRWAEILHQAGEDTSAAEVAAWGMRLLDGVAAYEDNRYDAAIAVFTAVLEYPELEPSLRPVALDWRGFIHWRANHYDHAIADFSEAIRLAPQVAEYWGDRGVANHMKQEYAAALADFDRALELEPDHDWTIVNRGQTYREMGQFDKALADFDRAIALGADNAWAIAMRGETYHRMGQHKQALTDFNRRIEFEPGVLLGHYLPRADLPRDETVRGGSGRLQPRD